MTHQCKKCKIYINSYRVDFCNSLCDRCFQASLPKEKNSNREEKQEREEELRLGKTMPSYLSGYCGYSIDAACQALFTTSSDKGQFVENYLIGGRDDVRITYTGKRLGIVDEDVFLQCLLLNQGLPAGETIIINRAEMRRRLGWKENNNTRLKKHLDNLSTALLHVYRGRSYYTARLLDSHDYQDNTKDYYIRLYPSVWRHFGRYTQLNLELRSHLSSVGKWLYHYFSSNSGLQKTKVETLHSWSGAKRELRKWKPDSLTPALEQLEDLKVIKNLQIDKNIIICEVIGRKKPFETLS